MQFCHTAHRQDTTNATSQTASAVPDKHTTPKTTRNGAIGCYSSVHSRLSRSECTNFASRPYENEASGPLRPERSIASRINETRKEERRKRMDGARRPRRSPFPDFAISGSGINTWVVESVRFLLSENHPLTLTRQRSVVPD